MFKSSSTLRKGLAVLMILSIVLAACAPAATPTPAPKPTEAPAQPTAAPKPTEPPATVVKATEPPQPTDTPKPTEPPAPAPFVSTPSGKKAPSGFECPAPASKIEVKSKELNLFVWSNYIPQDILDCFQEVYGIKINRKEYASNEEMYASLSQGGATYDLVQPSDYFVSLMIRQGMLQKLDQSQLAVLPYFDPNYLNLPFDPNNGYTIPYQAGTDGIVYNADKIKDPPKSYADLWKPEFLNSKHMVVLDDSRSVIGATLLTLGYDVNTKDPKQLEAAKTKLTELAKAVKLYDSDSPKTALIAGDADLGIVWTGDVELAHRENPAILYVYPSEGVVRWQDNYALVKDAPHLDAAYAWLNYSLQPDLFWLMLRDFPYSNPNKAALDFASTSTLKIKDANGNDTTPQELYKAYMASPITNTPPDALKAGHRMDDVGDATPLYDKIWTEIKQ